MPMQVKIDETVLETVAREGRFCQFHFTSGYVARGRVGAIHPDGWFELTNGEQPFNSAQLVRIEF